MAHLVFDQKERIGAWVAERTGQTASWGSFYAMGAVSDDGRVMGGIVANNFNGSNLTAHIAIDKPGKFLPELIRHFFLYAFVQNKLKRVTVMVSTALPKVLAFVRKIGFEDEFLMKDGAADGDMQFVVMWADKCRWIKEN